MHECAGSFSDWLHDDDLVQTYSQLAPVLLAHLKDRPLPLKRFPDDIYREAFWEKDASNFTPTWVKRFPVPRKTGGQSIHYISISDPVTLCWAACMGCIEIHADSANFCDPIRRPCR